MQRAWLWKRSGTKLWGVNWGVGGRQKEGERRLAVAFQRTPRGKGVERPVSRDKSGD